MCVCVSARVSRAEAYVYMDMFVPRFVFIDVFAFVPMCKYTCSYACLNRSASLDSSEQLCMYGGGYVGRSVSPSVGALVGGVGTCVCISCACMCTCALVSACVFDVHKYVARTMTACMCVCV